MAYATTPVIYYSDLTSGPNTGGQSNKGVFVTIWGNNFGATQSTSTVAVGSGNVDNYPTWSNTMICFQLGASVTTGNIVVTTSAGTSNGIPFTVRSGNIYFVQPGVGSNGTGTYASPFQHIAGAYAVMTAGDTVYVEAGTIDDEINGQTGWHSIMAIANSGTQADPLAWVAYPNATVTFEWDGATVGSDQVDYVFRSSGGSWVTVAKFNMVGSGGFNAINSPNYDGWRIVGNTITTTSWVDGIISFSNNYSQVLGNTIQNSGSGMAYDNESHGIYWNAGGTNVQIAWNTLYNNSHMGWGISLFHQGSASEPTRVGTVHDNMILNPNGNQMKGILVGDVDTGENQADVEAQNIQVYNNILYNTGVNENGGALQLWSGTGYIYNNTIYGCLDTDGAIQFPNGGIGPGGGAPVWYVADNIVYTQSSYKYLGGSGSGNPNYSEIALLTNNDYYGNGAAPSQDTSSLNVDPLFVTNGSNFNLQATSPLLAGAGYNTSAIVLQDFLGFPSSSSMWVGAYSGQTSSGSGGGSVGTGDLWSNLKIKKVIFD